MPEDLPLDPDLIKVLASDTRREILRHLRERNMTVTELARELDLGKATVHEHLNKLGDAGLVRRKEDDRLWVYYEVSPEGKRMLNPQRTRFYLIVAVSVLSAVAAVLALALFLSTGGGGGLDEDVTRSPEAVAQQGLAIQLQDASFYATGPTNLEATVQNAPTDAGQLRGYLVPASQADSLRQGDLSVTGIPLQSQPITEEAAMTERTSQPAADGGTEGTGDTAEQNQTTDRTITFQASGPLPAGDYVLFVRTDDGRYVPTDPTQDNRQQMPQVQVRDLQVDIQPDPWYTGISSSATVSVTSQGQPVDGRLSIEPVDQTPEATGINVRLTQGNGTVPTSVLDALPVGSYQLSVLPDGEDTWQIPGRTWALHRPQIAVQPAHIVTDQTSQVTVTVGPDQATAGQAPSIEVNGTPVLDRAHTEAGTVLTLAPEHPGTLELTIGRLAAAQVKAHPGLQPTLQVLDGPRWRLDVDELDGSPAANLTVLVDDQTVGTTDDTGQLDLGIPEEGTHRLTLLTPAGDTTEHGFQVDGWTPRALTPGLTVVPLTIEERDGIAHVSVRVSTAHPADVPATLTALLDDGSPASSRLVTVPAAGNATVDLEVPLAGQPGGQITLRASPLSMPGLAVDNRTSQQDGADAASGDGGGGSTSDADDDSLADSQDTSTATVELPGADGEMATEAGQAMMETSPGLEPVTGTSTTDDDAMDAADGAAEAPQDATPAPGLVALLAVLLVVAGWMARRR